MCNRSQARRLIQFGKSSLHVRIQRQADGDRAEHVVKVHTNVYLVFPETHPAFPSPAQVLTKDLPTLRTFHLQFHDTPPLNLH